MSNRREFLRTCAGVSATAIAASMSRLGIVDAFAQDHHRGGFQLATDYRALVCVFLAGGNDSWNTIVNLDDYALYAATRGGSGAAAGAVQPVPDRSRRPTAAGSACTRAWPVFKPLWDQGRLAAVVNVGSLLEPIDRATVPGAAGPAPAEPVLALRPGRAVEHVLREPGRC